MEIETTHTDGVTIVAPRGDLDFHTSRQMTQTVHDLITGGHSKLVVDVGRVVHIDSAGLAALMAGMRQARDAGGDLRLCNVQDAVRSILELTRLIHLLAVHPTRQAAIASWTDSAG
jgi:anti-sigma B factor antagonist